MSIRRDFFRWLGAAFFWVLVGACFLASVRAANLSGQAAAYIRERALTPTQASEDDLARELARSVAAEWATFDSDDPEGYAARMALLGVGKAVPPARGSQRCLSAAVLSVERPAPGQYRVEVLLRLNRLVSAEGAARPPEAAKLLSEGDVARIAGVAKPAGGPSSVRYWAGSLACASVSVAVRKGELAVLGSPVWVPLPRISGAPASEMASGEELPEGFETFARQALEFYYAGRDMSNFTAPGARTAPLGGWRVESAAVELFARREDAAVAVVKVEVSTPGVERLQQEVVLEAVEKEGRWFLKRVGSW